MAKKIYRVISIFLIILGLILISLIFVDDVAVLALVGMSFFTSGWIGYILSKNSKQ